MLRPLALLLVAAACGSQQPAHPGAGVDAARDGAPPAIDARGTADAPPSGLDPANDGTSTVTTHDASIPGSTSTRHVPATVYVPSPSLHALVVISPGFQMTRAQYASYAHHLATWGFVVILTDYADTGFFAAHQALADDVRAVNDWALAQGDLAIDATKIAAAGHSLGGDISVLAAAGDPRIKAVVGWDPVDATSPSVVPEKMSMVGAALAVIGETTNASGGGMPCAPAAENFEQFYASAGHPALKRTFAGADHMDWVDDPSCGFCGFCTAGTAAPEDVHTATRRLDVAWLRRQLFADAAMDVWLDAPGSVRK